MRLGIVGLPNVGKSTLFNSLTSAGAAAANYPFCTIDPNVGTVLVPDERLQVLGKMFESEKITPAYMEFVDIAGLVKGASKGEGLGNKFLSHIREVDAIIHVVRCFNDENVVHVDGGVDPIRDLETINLELIFSDIEILERRIDRVKKQLKGDRTLEKEVALYERVLAELNDGINARSVEYFPEELDIIANVPLLSRKKVIYVANLSEGDILPEADLIQKNEGYRKLSEYAKSEGSEIIPICANIEAEIMSFPEDERSIFMEELGIKQSGLDKLIKAGYRLLGLISFLTAGPKETRAWTITEGSRAPEAAGKIHTDFQKGFIRAETINYDNLITAGNMNAAREKGWIRSEGKEYIVRDGDIILFRFNV